MLDFDFNLEHNAAVELLQAAMKVQEMLPDIEYLFCFLATTTTGKQWGRPNSTYRKHGAFWRKR